METRVAEGRFEVAIEFPRITERPAGQADAE
jgi:hypothetical protein